MTCRSRLLHPPATRGNEMQIARLHKPYLDCQTCPPRPACPLFHQSNRSPPTFCLGQLWVQQGQNDHRRSNSPDSIRNDTYGWSRHHHDSRCTPLSSARCRRCRLRSIATRRRCICSRVDRGCRPLVQVGILFGGGRRSVGI